MAFTPTAAATGAAVAGASAAAAAPAAAATTILGLTLPEIAAITGGVGALTSIGGTLMSSQAASRAASAQSQLNLATMQQQNEATMARIAAAREQTAAQTQAMNQTMADRSAAATQMRGAQMGALQQQQDILAAENKQAEALRGTGDATAQALLAATTAQQQQASQDAAQAQAAALLAKVAPQGPGPTDPQGADPETKTAIARRLAEAATNVRDYGSKVAAVGAYQQPMQDINAAITATKTGIMPAQAAEALLRSGNTTRLLPSQVAFRNAGDIGAATDALLQSRGQGALDAAGLSYGNAVQLANLTQSDADTLASNKAAQAKQDAAFQQQVGGIFSGIGNLGLYGAGLIGGGPDWLTKLFPGGGATKAT